MTWLADATLDAHEYQANLKSLIFVGVFLLMCMAATIWWLRR